jgi:hypothetical protein
MPIDEPTLRNVAANLRRTGGYWSTFPEDVLMTWLLYNGKCVYCGDDLVTAKKMIGGEATADHLLPKSKYPHFDFAGGRIKGTYLNAVPSCSGCNCLKGSFDPNLDSFDLSRVDLLNHEMHLALIERSRDHINQKQRSRIESNERDRTNWRDALYRVANRPRQPLETA